MLLPALRTLAPEPARALSVPPDFVVENILPGPAFFTPVAVAFLPDGRMMVAEKRGYVWLVDNGIKSSVPIWSGSVEVLDNDDRGLLDVAVDPNYFVNHFIYLLYTVDPDSNGLDSDDDAFGRVTRYQVGFADSSRVDGSSRTVLIGASWGGGIPSGSPSHTVGSLRFGRDGSLLISCGDGAQFNSMDQGGQDPDLFLPGRTDPAEDIGAFRARWVGSLAGKVLRVDPATGLGLASNPFYDGNPASNRSRVWAYGLRNPFRFTVRPGTGSNDPSLGDPGTLYIGDVGWGSWEEANVARVGGLHFGWPCFEGPTPNAFYPVATPVHSGCDSSGTFGNPSPPKPPTTYWHHSDSTLSSPPGFTGNASVGGAFYTGTIYPLAWRGRYFFADYASDWIRSMVVDSADQVVQVEAFGQLLGGPVDVEIDPLSGDLVYVALYAGQVRRIRYVGTQSNSPPVAVADAYPQAGPSPLTVDFSAARSSDPEGDPLAYSWIFDDGSGSTERDPRHTYAAQGIYQAVLSVSDGRGGIGRDTVVIYADITEFPTTPLLDRFDRANGPLGTDWNDEFGSLVLSGGAVIPLGADGDAIWSGPEFGPDQEAYLTVTDASTATGAMHDLYLVVQGTSPSGGCVRVRYDAWNGEARIESYTPDDGWVPRGGPLSALLLPGDRLGARITPDGTVTVLKNGEVIVMGSIAGTPFALVGGHIGFGLENAPGARLDDFGGGDYTPPNTPPEVTIVSPADDSFFAAGDSLWLRCAAVDLQDSAATLHYHWELDLHHNNHLHPASFISDSAEVVLVPVNHDDGTGVWYTVSVRVTDSGNLADTAHVSIYPDVDLWPSPPGSSPRQPGTTAPATYIFTLHNSGRMPAPISRWRLRAGTTLLAVGDTVVPARDSVVIRRVVQPLLVPGLHALRVTADTLGTVRESNESNNAAMSEITVITGPGSDEVPPAFVSGPEAHPTGTTAHIQWSTDEPTIGWVLWGPTVALGDTVSAPVGTTHIEAIQNLEPGTTYCFRVIATDPSGNSTAAEIDSFTTLSGNLAAELPPLRFALSQFRPNPGAGRMALALELPRRARVEMQVLDVAGREVWRAPARAFEAGRWSLEWARASDARPGLYLARVLVDGKAFVRRLVLLR